MPAARIESAQGIQLIEAVQINAATTGHNIVNAVGRVEPLVVVIVAVENHLHAITLRDGPDPLLKFQSIGHAVVIRIIRAMEGGSIDGDMKKKEFPRFV